MRLFLIKGRLLGTALTSHEDDSNDQGSPQNLTPSEFKTPKHAAKK